MNLLQEADQSFLNGVQHVETPIGMVAKISFSVPIPPGWRQLTIEEGKEIKEYLNQLLEEWSIVAFKTGKLDGFGYGNKFMESYGQ